MKKASNRTYFSLKSSLVHIKYSLFSDGKVNLEFVSLNRVCSNSGHIVLMTRDQTKIMLINHSIP